MNFFNSITDGGGNTSTNPGAIAGDIVKAPPPPPAPPPVPVPVPLPLALPLALPFLEAGAKGDASRETLRLLVADVGWLLPREFGLGLGFGLETVRDRDRDDVDDAETPTVSPLVLVDGSGERFSDPLLVFR